MAATTTASRRKLLDAAGEGDADAFRILVDPHRAALHAHCYRMLGSLHDAEDALQEALLRAWRGMSGVDHPEALRSWLYRVATNSCIDAAKGRPPRSLSMDSGPPSAPDVEIAEPLVETASVQPYPDEAIGLADGPAAPDARYEQREAVELAFVAALQHLPPKPRACLILQEVLGFSAKEIAETLDTTVASVNSALQRARKTVEERLPERTQQESIRALGDARSRGLAAKFMDAWRDADVPRIRELLAADATFSMPPSDYWWWGREAIAELAEAVKPKCPPSRWIPIQASGQIAFGCYSWDPEASDFLPSAISTFEIEGAVITDMTSFVMPELFPSFGLPPKLPG